MGIYAVGDIHGYLNKLESLIGRLHLTVGDRLVFLGDYIDRGPDSKRVVDFLLELATRFDCVFLMGNHEHMLRDHLAGGINYAPEAWKYNGGIETLISYRKAFGPGEMPIPQEHIDFLTDLPYYHVECGFVFVHGGLRAGEPLERNNYKSFLWPRSAFYASHYRWPEGIVVFGHTPFREPLVQPNKIGIDTGSVVSGNPFPETARRTTRSRTRHTARSEISESRGGMRTTCAELVPVRACFELVSGLRTSLALRAVQQKSRRQNRRLSRGGDGES